MTLGGALRLGRVGSSDASSGLVAQVAFRRSKRGRVAPVVRERYLRDDVGLGRVAGRAALRDEAELAEVLGDEHLAANGARLVLFLDTNVALRQLDVLEREDVAAFHNVVMCDTVLREMRRLDLGAYNRALNLLKDDKRAFVSFPNENHRECWSAQVAGESANDYNDRLIRRAAQWYAQQLSAAGVATVLLLTNDRRCKELAHKEGLEAESIQDFVAGIAQRYPGLVDLVAESHESAEASGTIGAGRGAQVARFDSHLSEAEVARRLKAGQLVQGVFRGLAFGTSAEGSVMVFSKGDDEGARKVVIRGARAMNRAVEGDRVAVQLIDRAESAALRRPLALGPEEGEGGAEADDLAAPADGLLDQPASGPSTASLAGTELASLGSGAAGAAAETEAAAAVLYGKVVGIIKRNWRQYAGSVDERDATRAVPSESVLVLPVDSKVPKIRIKTRQLADIKNQRILVAVDGWDRFSAFPTGHFVRALGPIGDRETETKVILHEHDIPTREFSSRVLQCLPPEGKAWVVTPENSKGREDLRHPPVCSIDPPGCKDIDDALHVRALPNGNIEVGVHIADVTHFVRPGTDIDKEAADRGTSTYLVERRLDMLPGLLTTDICSLVGKVDRFTFSVIWEFTPPLEGAERREANGEHGDDGRGLRQVSVRFCKAVIHSRAALSYGEAQAWLDDPSARGELPDAVRMLAKVARVLRVRRTEAGALTLASQEVRFKLDNDSHDPTDVEMYQQKEANQLVEEFMLLGNIAVARRTAEAFPSHAMLRRHPRPSKEMFQELLQAAKIGAGVELEVGSSLELAQSLDRAVVPGRPFFNKLVRILATRCMMQAVYFCSGEVARDEWGHYGLATPIYTHFTSPIRRYADVVAHRLLAAAEGIDPLPGNADSKEALHQLSDNLNARHHAAQLAGRASAALHTVVFFRGRPTECEAMISRVRERGIVVVVPEYGIEGKVALAADEAEARETLTYDPKRMRIVHNKLPQHPLQIFDVVKVRLQVETRVGYRQNLVITLVDPPLPTPGAQELAQRVALTAQRERAAKPANNTNTNKRAAQDEPAEDNAEARGAKSSKGKQRKLT